MDFKRIFVPFCLLLTVIFSMVTSQCIDSSHNPDYPCDYTDVQLFGECIVRGDPHITTFDGHKYNFQGDCYYILVDFCEEADTFLQINAYFRKRPANSAQSRATAVSVVIGGKTYTLSKSGVLIDSAPLEEEDLPYEKDSNNVEIFQFNENTCIIRICDAVGNLLFRISYNKKYHIIRIHANRDQYHQDLCGMCGYWNDRDSDDFKSSKNTIKSISIPSSNNGRRRRSGTIKKTKSGTSVQKFGDKWKIDELC